MKIGYNLLNVAGGSVLSIVMVILGFGITIFVHELGHFLMARRAGVQVISFSIGMGPKIWSIHTDSKGTEWMLSLLPLGGYVRMRGQEDNPFDTQAAKGAKNDYRTKTPLQRLSIILAGVVMNALFAYLLLVIAYRMGVPFTSNTIGSVQPRSISEKLGLHPDDKIVKIGNKAVESWEDFMTFLTLQKDQKHIFLSVERDGKILSFDVPSDSVKEKFVENTPIIDLGLSPLQFLVVKKLGPLTDDKTVEKGEIQVGDHILGARLDHSEKIYKTPYGITRLIQNNPGKVVVFTVAKQEKEGSHGVPFETSLVIPSEESLSNETIQTLPVVKPTEDGTAILSGVKEGDIITQIDGKPIRGWNDLYNYFLTLTSDVPLRLDILRDGVPLTLSVPPYYDPAQERFLIGITPLQDDRGKTISYVSPQMAAQFNPPMVGDKLLKVEVTGNKIVYALLRDSDTFFSTIPVGRIPKESMGHLFDFSVSEKIVRYSLWGSIRHSFLRTYYEIRDTYSFLSSIISGKLSTKLIGGPIRIFQISHFIAENKSLSYFLLLFAKIGFSLAIINALPIPVLDGGHALLILIEMIRKKPFSERFLINYHKSGFIFIILLTFFVFYNDITNLLGSP